MAKVLIVLTSHDKLGDTGEKTGFWSEEFAAPYYRLVDAGVAITLASPAGGEAPLDPKSELPDFQTDATRRLAQDPQTQALLADTQRLSQLSVDAFDAVFYPGGHGPLWDLTEDADSIALIQRFLASDKPVATVCHATAVLLNAKTEAGKPVVAGKRITGFTNGEEAAVGLTEIVPFLLEDALIAQGALYQKEADWHPLAVEDGALITGQNPQSSEAVAERLLARLQA
ncbi:type 1 glutamine amidotransferase domain-containing protein [Ferrimonas pelagia]|uniref:Type 1 glutamine amidotransferase domain-containing protein n=1 Tax=Ferrimonas pelagia TaxID=1177826 RepID=A0ABP9EXL0_9GAMM